jgi:small subunit ribosomal protein S20
VIIKGNYRLTSQVRLRIQERQFLVISQENRLRRKTLANHASAEKRQRQNEKLRIRNKGVRSEMRTQVKKVLQSVEGKDPQASADLNEATRLINRAASKGILKKRTASRKISRLSKSVNSIATA